MRRWILEVLCIAAVAAIIGCTQSACQSVPNQEDAKTDYPYKGPIQDENGQAVQPPDWGN